MSQVLGLGTDIVEIDRIKQSIIKHQNHFLDRLFTKNEQDYCQGHRNPEVQFAGRYAAKEAIAKAIGSGFGKELKWTDFEIVNQENGKPEVVFIHSSPLKILVSISHCRTYAVATAIRIA